MMLLLWTLVCHVYVAQVGPIHVHITTPFWLQTDEADR